MQEALGGLAVLVDVHGDEGEGLVGVEGGDADEAVLVDFEVGGVVAVAHGDCFVAEALGSGLVLFEPWGVLLKTHAAPWLLDCCFAAQH